MCGSSTVTIGISVVVTAILSHSPAHLTIHIDEGPAVHFAFPVLVEDGDHSTATALDGVSRTGNGAVVVATHLSVCPDGHALFDLDSSCIWSPWTVF